MSRRVEVFRSLGLSVLLALGSASLVFASSASAPNDPYFGQQWSLHNDGSSQQIVPIDADDFHTIDQVGVPGVDIGWLQARSEAAAEAKSPVTVAVIDSGLDAGHPDLTGRVAPGAWDFLTGFPFVTDPLGHGTHVSGIIAANDDNGIGIAGIAPPSVKILPLRILWDGSDPRANGFSYIDPASDPTRPTYKLISDFAADAIRYAVSHGASIINMSLGWPKIVDTANVRAAVQAAVKAGVLVVAAAGNDRKDQPTYPCSYEGVLCVGAVTNTGAMAIYSNTGGRVDLLAPGDSILSTYPTQVESQVLRINGYELLSGTSQAAPEVAAIAAVLKSAHPGISLNELKARLLLSAAPIPSRGAALYGLVNEKRALDATPQPVYLPDFKSIDEIPVDEKTLTAQGRISVEDLWKPAQGVHVDVLVNGIPSGSARAAALASGASITVPWSYHFTSLDESSQLQITVKVSDASGMSKEFSVAGSAVRRMESIAGNQSFQIPGVKPDDWMTVNNGHFFAKVYSVESYPQETGLPRYYRQLGWSNAGGFLQIYDAEAKTPLVQVQIPQMQAIQEVVRADVKEDGRRDWVVIGLGNDVGHPGIHFEFYFLDPAFQPLFGTQDASTYQVPVLYDRKSGNGFADGIRVTRNYASPGAWIHGEGMLLPAFMDSGALPAKDNFSELDMRHYVTAEHLYYLSPLPPSHGPVQMEVRALDNAEFRTRFPDAHLQNVIPGSDLDESIGRVRVLVSMGDNLTAHTMIWDVESTLMASTLEAPGWDTLSASGQPYPALSAGALDQNGSAFLNFFDTARGSLAWVDPSGAFEDRVEFEYKRPENPLVGLIGAFNIPSLGRFWFAESGFDLVAYREGQPGAEVLMKTLPIERDSSFAFNQFSQMFAPVLVGSSSAPEPGVYVDSTLVRGNQVAVAVWNPSTNELVKPLRYSLQVPNDCLQMNPVRISSGSSSFALPLLCRDQSSMRMLVVEP